MSKLREQLLMNDRLREYIERMLTVIIENSPQLLEITMNANAHMGPIMGMPMNSSTDHPIQSFTISPEELQNKPTPLTPLDATESTDSNSLNTSTTSKKSNDKYCHL